jgi:ribonuclease P protein component
MTALPEKPGALRRLKKRSEYLRTARGNRAGRAAFSLQATGREAAGPGIGFTVTKRTGNAPERNRIKRRLRAAARACAERFESQHDYVLVGRREALSQPFGKLVGELCTAINKIHASMGESPRDKR